MTWILQPGCDCVARNDLRACDECEPEGEYISCLDYFDISVTLPDVYGTYSGTYSCNQSARYTREEIRLRGSCQENYASYGYVNIAVRLYRIYFVAGIHFQVLVSTPTYAGRYGTTFSKGSWKLVEYVTCEGHCNGSFLGVRADPFFYYTLDHNPYGWADSFKAWISKAPGSFELPYNRFWHDDPFNFSPPCNTGCPDQPDYEPQPSIKVEWKLKTRQATQADVNNGWAQKVGDSIPITFPYHLMRY